VAEAACSAALARVARKTTRLSGRALWLIRVPRSKLAELGDEVELSLIEAERELANRLYREGELKDEGRRRIERDLDLRDALLANLRAKE
jgi:hypothetical protein